MKEVLVDIECCQAFGAPTERTFIMVQSLKGTWLTPRIPARPARGCSRRAWKRRNRSRFVQVPDGPPRQISFPKPNYDKMVAAVSQHLKEFQERRA